MLSREFFAGNRAELKRRNKDAELIVVAGHKRMQRSRDTTFPFRQNSSFYYLTGVNAADVVLVMDIAKGEEWLIVPQLSRTERIFDGDIGESILAAGGITTFYSGAAGWRKLILRARSAGTVYTIVPRAYKGRVLINNAQGAFCDYLRSRRVTLKDIARDIARMRTIKQPEEIVCIQKAIDITISTLQGVFSNVSRMKYEREVEAQITAGFRSHGADGHAYDPIIASGKNACTLHYVRNSGSLGAQDLLLVDVGAEYSGYAADITRTIALGRPTKRQISAHKTVRTLQQELIEMIEPGITLQELDKLAHEKMSALLKGLGLAKRPGKHTIRRYFPHSVSHYIGLDVHDVGDPRWKLQPGMIVTVEPGIYIEKEALGVRIEDDVLITESGAKNLSEGLSRDLEF